MTFTADVSLADMALHNGVINISPQLFGSNELNRIFPQGMKIPVKGTHLYRLDGLLGRDGNLGRFRAPGRGPACAPGGRRGLDPVAHEDRMRAGLVVVRRALGRCGGGNHGPFST